MAEERTEDFKTEIAELRQRSVQEVAEALGLTFNGNEWTEHDSFKLDLKKNRASWYSRGEDYKNMDVFQLVMVTRLMFSKSLKIYCKLSSITTFGICTI